MALSIAVTWIWAPALFVSSEKAYTSGIPGLFWFLVPNVLCLLIFIPFANRIRQEMPNGFTLSEYMSKCYSRRVKGIYLFQLSGLSILSTAVQLLAGGKILSTITGIPFWLVTVLLSVIVFLYSNRRGIITSVYTDMIQMVFILFAGFIFLAWALKIKGLGPLLDGLGGISGDYKHLFDLKGIEVMLTFGIPTAIGLIAGPFGDQSFWQRVFSVKDKALTKAFSLGAFLFSLVPLMMAAIGFIAAGDGFVPSDLSVVNQEFIAFIFPSWAVWVFVVMLLCGLMSTVDSNLCSFTSLMNDVRDTFDIKHFKFGMAGMLVIAIFIANIPGLGIVHLFLFYGALRAVTFLPTVLTLLHVKLSEQGVFYGVFISLLIALPISAYGNLFDVPELKTIGSILAILLSGVIALIVTKAGGRTVAR